MKPCIAILGEYKPGYEPHLATQEAIAHSGAQLGRAIEAVWISTENINNALFETYAGIWIAPGSPYKNMEKMLQAIRYARENNLPCLGTCGGFQHMVLEYARSVLGFKEAESQENDPYASQLFISQLDCSLFGRKMELTLVEGSRIAMIYGSLKTVERYYCNFGVNPEYMPVLKSRSLNVTGSDVEGEVRVVELPGHPFFIGTLFVPQTRSTAETPHPVVTAFIEAIIKSAA
ncbi:MAG: CTP synthase [Cyanobacteria bacterium J06638_22]